VPAALALPLDAADHVSGPVDAPLELVMYGDFQCPYCTAAQPIVARVRTRLEGRLRFAFRHFPLPEVHPDASRAAEASEAAAAQDAFWPFHDAAYANRGHLAEADLLAIAGRLGLDAARVADELRVGAHAARVERDVESGRASGVDGTPAFFANGTRVEGAFDAGSLVQALISGR
jgi:protein-disulfide isomerase